MTTKEEILTLIRLGHYQHDQCFVISNNRRPTKKGYYNTITSKNEHQVTLFSQRHWQIGFNQEPVVKWQDISLN